MKALILAAGYGNRMRPLTDGTHKTLLNIAGRPIIDRIVSGLMDNGINHIILVTGYRATELTEHVLSAFPGAVFEFIHNPHYRETNNIFSMALAFDAIELDADILLIESDLIYDPEVITRAIHSKYENVALVSPYRTGLDGTVVEVSEDRITSIYPTHLQGSNFNLFDKYKTLNIYRFSKRFCENEFKKLLVYYAKAIDKNCYYELILGILIYMQRETINCEIIDNSKWAEVDDPNDLRSAEFVFNKKNRLEILENGFGGYWNYDVLDFCFLRNMYFPTKSVISEIRNNLPDLIHNYGSRQVLLNEKLAYVVECKQDNIFALNGASQAYPILSNLFKGKRCLLPAPTFGEYPRWFDVHATYRDLDGVDRNEIENKSNDCDLVVFVNPNQPSGTSIDSSWILALADRYPEKLFVVDESFIEFSSERSLIPSLEDVSRENILVIKSMSKTHGIPGIRLGFVYTRNAALLKRIEREIPIWNLNGIAEFYLEILLKNKSALTKSFVQTAKDRAIFSEQLAELGVFDRVFPSGGNYLLVRGVASTFPTRSLVEYLLSEYSIYIKDVTEKMSDPDFLYFRIAVRLPSENAQLLSAIRQYRALG